MYLSSLIPSPLCAAQRDSGALPAPPRHLRVKGGGQRGLRGFEASRAAPGPQGAGRGALPAARAGLPLPLPWREGAVGGKAGPQPEREAAAPPPRPARHSARHGALAGRYAGAGGALAAHPAADAGPGRLGKREPM